MLAWGGAAALILLPLVAMQFTDEVAWKRSDFLFAVALIGGLGLAFELAVRLSANRAYRAGVAFALLAILLLVWINLAVGIIGSEDNPANRMFAAVPIVAVGGALAARFRASGMRWASIAAAVTHVAVAIAAFLWAEAFIFPITGMFCGLWLASAWLFAKAAAAPHDGLSFS
jgi:hypothetical protein